MREMTEHDQWLKGQLQDADFAAEYLNAAQEDDDPQVYLLALRKVVEARSSLKDVALQSNLSRETLYRTLSAKGNPTLKTLNAVFKATGLEMHVMPRGDGSQRGSRTPDTRVFNGDGVNYAFTNNSLHGDIFGVRTSVFLMSF